MLQIAEVDFDDEFVLLTQTASELKYKVPLPGLKAQIQDFVASHVI